MPYTTVIRLHVVVRNPANGFPARLLGRTLCVLATSLRTARATSGGSSMGGRPPFRPGRQRLRVRAAPAAQSLCALGRSAGRHHAGTWRLLPRRGRWHRRDHQGDDAGLSLGIYEAVSMIVHVLPPIGQGRSSRADLTPPHLEGKRRWLVDSSFRPPGRGWAALATAHPLPPPPPR